MQTRRAVRAASRASEQENNRVNNSACLDEVDVVLPGRRVDVGHWVEGENVASTQESSFPSARPPTLQHPLRLGHPTSRPAPSAAGGRSALRPRGSEPRRGCLGSSAQPPNRRRPDCGIGGRRSHAHACRGQPGATPPAKPPRPLRKGPPGSAVSAPPRPPSVAAGHASPGSARGLLSGAIKSELQDLDGPFVRGARQLRLPPKYRQVDSTHCQILGNAKRHSQ